MASQLGLPLVPDTSYYYPRFYLGLSEGEKRESGEIPSCDMCFDGRYYAVSGFITGAIGAKFPGMNHLVEGVVDTTVSAGERLAYAVFDDSMSWDEKWAYAFDPGQMVADFVTGVVIGEILDGIMAATQNKLRSIFANYDATMREAIETSYGKSREIIQCNTKDAAADELAKRIGGQSRSAFADDPIQREFDVISDQYIAQAKPPLKCVNKVSRTRFHLLFEMCTSLHKC